MRWKIVAAATTVALMAIIAIAVRTSGSDSGDADPRAEVRLRVSVEQWRQDEVAHTVQVAMRNDGQYPVRVRQVELIAPSFAGQGPVDVDAPLPPGGLRVDVTVPYGAGRCTGDELNPTSAPAHVALMVHTEDGADRPVRIALEQPNAMLNKLLAQECLQQRLGRVLRLSFGPWTVTADGSLSGTLNAEHTGSGGSVTLHDVGGNILFKLGTVPADRQRPLGTLTPQQPRLAIPVLAAVDRCSAHVLAEIKKPYLFPAFVSVDASQKLYSEIGITDADRTAFDALAKRQCKPSGQGI